MQLDLQSCTNCGAIATSETIINKWFPYFGLPLEFDCDLGSAFVSKVFKTLLESLNQCIIIGLVKLNV